MSDVCNIEFLDLSDVDTTEQIRLRASLRHINPSVQLPWYTNSQTPTFGIKQAKRAHIANNIANNVANHESKRPVTSVVYNDQQLSSSHHILTDNDCQSNSASNFTPLPSFPYPQLTHPIAETDDNNTSYSCTPGASDMYPGAPVSFPSLPPSSQQRRHKKASLQNKSVTLHNGVGEEVIERPTATACNNQLKTQSQAVTGPIEHQTGENRNQSPVSEKAMPSSPPADTVVQNGVEPKPTQQAAKPKAWGTKSWASLFEASTSNGVTYFGQYAEKTQTQTANEALNTNGVVCPLKNPRKRQFIDPDCYRMGEFLMCYSVDGRAVSLQPRGLINQSTYCYINSILQALVACPPLYNLLSGLAENVSSNEKRRPTPAIDGMCRFVREFKQLPANLRVNNRRSDPKNQKKEQNVMINTDVPFEPLWIYKMLNRIRTDLIEGRQEDAEEFLGCLLNGLNDEMLEMIKLVKTDCDAKTQTAHASEVENDADKEWQVMGPKNKGSVTRRTDFDRTPVSDIFGGLLRSKIHRAGDQVTENIQPFFTLQLNITKVKTVREALEALITKNQLEGLTSSKTNEEVEAWQQVMLDELPVVLVLHLKCFDYKPHGCTKIVKALEFPIDLKIDSKLLASSKTHQMPKEKQYKLFAVVYHDGWEATKGHYVTDAFHVGYSSWLRYDDASVRSVQEEQVLRPQGTRVPYLLFYRRSDTIRSK